MSGKKWPTKFVMKSREWTIRYLDRDHPDMDEIEGEGLLGWCDSTTHEVAICKKQSIESRRDTLIHEMCHAYYSTMPGVDHDDEKAEENWVLAMTELFFEITRNAPWDWYKP